MLLNSTVFLEGQNTVLCFLPACVFRLGYVSDFIKSDKIRINDGGI